MNGSKEKNIILRAFRIKNPSPTSSNSGIREKLECELNKVCAKDRSLVLDPNDIKQEQILVSNFDSYAQNQSLFCTMLKMELTDNVKQVSDDLLKLPKFTIEELDMQQLQTAGIYKEHFYFSVLNDFLVTALLPINRTIKTLQTYLSWFLKDEMIEIYPMVERMDNYKLSDLKTAVFEDCSKYRFAKNVEQEKENTIGNKVKQISLDMLKNLFKECDDFKEIEQLESIISAQLLIKFKKPKKMTEDDYEKILGASLKSVADLDDVQFKTKDNKKIVSGKELHKTKEVKIQLASNGSIIEEDLKQEMARFLYELQK